MVYARGGATPAKALRQLPAFARSPSPTHETRTPKPQNPKPKIQNLKLQAQDEPYPSSPRLLLSHQPQPLNPNPAIPLPPPPGLLHLSFEFRPRVFPNEGTPWQMKYLIPHDCCPPLRHQRHADTPALARSRTLTARVTTHVLMPIARELSLLSAGLARPLPQHGQVRTERERGVEGEEGGCV